MSWACEELQLDAWVTLGHWRSTWQEPAFCNLPARRPAKHHLSGWVNRNMPSMLGGKDTIFDVVNTDAKEFLASVGQTGCVGFGLSDALLIQRLGKLPKLKIMVPAITSHPQSIREETPELRGKTAYQATAVKIFINQRLRPVIAVGAKDKL